MSREEIQALIKTHLSRLEQAKNILTENDFEFEQNQPEQCDYWIDEFKKETKILDWLKSLAPNDP